MFSVMRWLSGRAVLAELDPSPIEHDPTRGFDYYTLSVGPLPMLGEL